jgi:hypothetical protein
MLIDPFASEQELAFVTDFVTRNVQLEAHVVWTFQDKDAEQFPSETMRLYAPPVNPVKSSFVEVKPLGPDHI